MTSTLALGPKMMPLGLISSTLPFDCRAPRIWEGLPPTTRLSTALKADGWTNLVVSLAAILKPCQLMMALWLLVTVMVLPLVAMPAVPLTTCGPVGKAVAVPTPSANNAAAKAPPTVTGRGPPLAATFSATTTQASLTLLQINRKILFMVSPLATVTPPSQPPPAGWRSSCLPPQEGEGRGGGYSQ